MGLFINFEYRSFRGHRYNATEWVLLIPLFKSIFRGLTYKSDSTPHCIQNSIEYPWLPRLHLLPTRCFESETSPNVRHARPALRTSEILIPQLLCFPQGLVSVRDPYTGSRSYEQGLRGAGRPNRISDMTKHTLLSAIYGRRTENIARLLNRMLMSACQYKSTF